MFLLKIFPPFYAFYLYKRGYAKHIYKMQFKSKKFRKFRTRILDFIDIFYISQFFFQFIDTNKFYPYLRSYIK
jgi:hypothetical protein